MPELQGGAGCYHVGWWALTLTGLAGWRFMVRGHFLPHLEKRATVCSFALNPDKFAATCPFHLSTLSRLLTHRILTINSAAARLKAHLLGRSRARLVKIIDFRGFFGFWIDKDGVG